jgi:hypothetical protein
MEINFRKTAQAKMQNENINQQIPFLIFIMDEPFSVYTARYCSAHKSVYCV